MKNKLLSIFLAFIRKSFSKERLLNFISELLDILYERYGPFDVDLIDDLIDGSDKDV